MRKYENSYFKVTFFKDKISILQKDIEEKIIYVKNIQSIAFYNFSEKYIKIYTENEIIKLNCSDISTDIMNELYDNLQKKLK